MEKGTNKRIPKLYNTFRNWHCINTFDKIQWVLVMEGRQIIVILMAIFRLKFYLAEYMLIRFYLNLFKR